MLNNATIQITSTHNNIPSSQLIKIDMISMWQIICGSILNYYSLLRGRIYTCIHEHLDSVVQERRTQRTARTNLSLLNWPFFPRGTWRNPRWWCCRPPSSPPPSHSITCTAHCHCHWHTSHSHCHSSFEDHCHGAIYTASNYCALVDAVSASDGVGDNGNGASEPPAVFIISAAVFCDTCLKQINEP